MNNYIIYQAYGNPDIRNEALFSILTLLRVNNEAHVVVYTDEPTHFQKILPASSTLKYVLIEPNQWQEWRGEIDFVHRVKIKMLQHACALFNGNILYVDTDTVFRHSPTEIFAAIANGTRFMHLAEGELGNGNLLNRKVNRALKRDAGRTSLHGGPIPATTRMYNAGALGFRSSDAVLLDDVLVLTEQLFRLYPKHVMEQLAFSVSLARAGEILEAAPWIYHYWNLKEIRPVLKQLFSASAPLQLKDWQARVAVLDIPALADSKAIFRQHPSWRRTLLRWRGRDWTLPVFEF